MTILLTPSPPKLSLAFPPPAPAPAPDSPASLDLTTPAGVFFFFCLITATLPESSSSPSFWSKLRVGGEAAAEAGERSEEVEPEGRILLRFLKVEMGVGGSVSDMVRQW